ncbi:hypothetical protein KCU62_g336, partial [Aureobasidium sp. EXF-3399]
MSSAESPWLRPFPQYSLLKISRWASANHRKASELLDPEGGGSSQLRTGATVSGVVPDVLSPVKPTTCRSKLDRKFCTGSSCSDTQKLLTSDSLGGEKTGSEVAFSLVICVSFCVLGNELLGCVHLAGSSRNLLILGGKRSSFRRRFFRMCWMIKLETPRTKNVHPTEMTRIWYQTWCRKRSNIAISLQQRGSIEGIIDSNEDSRAMWHITFDWQRR